MERNPSREADSHSAIQEFPFRLYEPKVHYSVYKKPLSLKFNLLSSSYHKLIHIFKSNQRVKRCRTKWISYIFKMCSL
jgi:hypothetical protein